MTLASELKITEKQIKLLTDIVLSHECFPELALDGKFSNSFYKPKDPTISDLIERDFIKKENKSLVLSKSFAKKYWNDLVNLVPLPKVLDRPFSENFLMTKSFEQLSQAYHTLTSQECSIKNKEELIKEIIKLTQTEKVKPMVEKKKEVKAKVAKEPVDEKKKEVKAKVAKEPVDDGKLSPKEVAKELGIEPATVRKILRKLYKKPEDGNWRISEDQIDEIEEAHNAYREQVAKNKAERLEKLKAAREKSKEEKVAKKSSKKSSKKVEEDED
mgnify:CR=1 FL=1